jgi:hypothetical protein
MTAARNVSSAETRELGRRVERCALRQCGRDSNAGVGLITAVGGRESRFVEPYAALDLQAPGPASPHEFAPAGRKGGGTGHYSRGPPGDNSANQRRSAGEANAECWWGCRSDGAPELLSRRADRHQEDPAGPSIPGLVSVMNQANRGAGIRTRDLLLPKQARYRTAPHPVTKRRWKVTVGGEK